MADTPVPLSSGLLDLSRPGIPPVPRSAAEINPVTRLASMILRPCLTLRKFGRACCCCPPSPNCSVTRDQYKEWLRSCQALPPLSDEQRREAIKPFIRGNIPASKWCVTKSDFRRLRDEVMVAWELGLILPRSDGSGSRHWNPKIGPSLYDVNNQFIKPITRNAGGTSYALMLHPEGIVCDLFVSHAWEEGFFEFADKVISNWPRGSDALWCCILANPQNLDITELLEGPVQETPFAVALASRPHVVVIPNSRKSIWTRLWCVIEAWYAYQLKMDVIVPNEVTWEQFLPEIRNGALSLLGGVLFLFLLWVFSLRLQAFLHVLELAVFSAWLILFIFLFCVVQGWLAQPRYKAFVRGVPLVLLFIDGVCIEMAILLLETQYLFSSFLDIFTCIIAIYLRLQYAKTTAEQMRLREGLTMDRDGVLNIDSARCHPADEIRLREIVTQNSAAIRDAITQISRFGALNSELVQGRSDDVYYAPGDGRQDLIRDISRAAMFCVPWVTALLARLRFFENWFLFFFMFVLLCWTIVFLWFSIGFRRYLFAFAWFSNGLATFVFTSRVVYDNVSRWFTKVDDEDASRTSYTQAVFLIMLVLWAFVIAVGLDRWRRVMRILSCDRAVTPSTIPTAAPEERGVSVPRLAVGS
eukprot:TRINITY_DN1495_c0_g1_i2.p1 TRINITY_DN1495_c0_g1~~TRINITY_DN1495_c0_g1_i2.p1  ORF type:complete len:641 (-),score=62.18 TRINITY_DN1495_c0_g1_i2:50-1972(-)